MRACQRVGGWVKSVCQNACFDLISPISTLRAAFSPSMKSLLPDGLLDKDGPRRQAQAWLPVGKSIHERKRISRGVPPDVCHAHKANARVTSISAAAARQLAIMRYARSVPPSSALDNAIADRSGFVETKGPKRRPVFGGSKPAGKYLARFSRN